MKPYLCNRLVVIALATLFSCVPVNVMLAHGRSFPIEVTGTITAVDPRMAKFTMSTDQPDGDLSLAIGENCKFTRAGQPATGEVVKKGRHIKASYFSTLFTGKIAVQVESDPVPEVATGVVETVDLSNKRISLRQPGAWRALVLRWTGRTQFARHGRPGSPSDVHAGEAVKVHYYAFEFQPKYAIAVEDAPRGGAR